MATVTLRTVWLNDAADPADVIALPEWVEVSRSPEWSVEYRVVAGGRVRQIVTQGVSRSWSIGIDWCPPDVLAWLEGHATRLVCVRDPDGRKGFGSYKAVPSAHIKAPGSHSTVSLTITEVTYSEAI